MGNWEAVLNNDMIGNPKAGETGEINTRILRVFSEGLPYKDLDKKQWQSEIWVLKMIVNPGQLARYIKEITEQYVKGLEIKLIYRNDRFFAWRRSYQLCE